MVQKECIPVKAPQDMVKNNIGHRGPLAVLAITAGSCSRMLPTQLIKRANDHHHKTEIQKFLGSTRIQAGMEADIIG